MTAELPDLSEVVGDDIAYWINNPFMTPDLLLGKVQWWLAEVSRETAKRIERNSWPTSEVELRLGRMADAANEAEIRWFIGEWLTDIHRAVTRDHPAHEEVSRG